MNVKPKLPRKKKCKMCQGLFQPTRSIQPCCNFNCELAYATEHAKKKAANRELQEQKKDRAAKREASKKKAEFYDNDRSHQLKLTQSTFNAWIRFRDSGKPCVSCDKPDSGTHQRHASHFRSVGACAELRFNSLNVHTSCSVCNNHLSGNIAGYRPRLIDKIGIELVEWLEGPHEQKKYTCDQLREIRAYYAKLTRQGIKSDEDRQNK